jgi:hypothetical protein
MDRKHITGLERMQMKVLLWLIVMLCIVAPAAVAHTITQAEYYFDSDPGYGAGMPLPVSPDSDVVAVDDISLNGLQRGFHTLFVRFEDNHGNWSLPIRRSFSVFPERLGPNHIVGGEVFFDTDPGIGLGCLLAATDGAFDSSDEDMLRLVLPSNLTLGQHYAYVRTRDALGFWSPVRAAGFSVAEPIELHLVAASADSNSGHARLMWTKFLEAIEYHVHYDSVVNGQFGDYITVSAPDTSLTLVTPPQNYVKRFYRVVAIMPDAETCISPMPGERGEPNPRKSPAMSSLPQSQQKTNSR